MADKQKKPKPSEKESWSFGKEGDYAEDKLWTMERILALGFFVLWVGLVADERGGVRALRAATFYLGPLACIWWPEIMRRYFAERDPCTDTSYPWPRGCLRWIAWTLLLWPAIVWVLQTIRR